MQTYHTGDYVDELQQVIKGSLFLSSIMETIDDGAHEHVSLAKKVAESVLYGTINEYEKLHGKDALTDFLATLPEVQLEDSSSDEDRGGAVASSV